MTASILAVGLMVSTSASAQTLIPQVEGGTQCSALLAGQSIDAGSVCVTVVGEDLVVTYATTGGWTIDEAHLWVGESLTEMPQTRTGNPRPGRFPYASGPIAGATTWSVTIPLSDDDIYFGCPLPAGVSGVTYALAAHAAVRRADGNGGYQTETGWADGAEITSKGNWATVASFRLVCVGEDDDNEESNVTEETAFALDPAAATCFLDIDGFSTNRWGWTNGPYSASRPLNVVMAVYAGAGRCDTAKGTLVGALTVTYQPGGAVSVSFATQTGFTLEETHVYVGLDELPIVKGTQTVAPGQYPQQHDLTGAVADTFLFPAPGGDFHVIAHAVVAGDYGK